MTESSAATSLTIFLNGELTEQQIAQIKASVPTANVRYYPTRTDMEEGVEQADIIAGSISPVGLAKATRLKWVQSWLAGTNEILFPEMVVSPVTVTSCASNGAIPLAEHAVMLMLMLSRNASQWVRNQDQQRWERWYHSELNGLTCGIIGLGFSGQDLALKLKGFHMRVIGMRRTPRPTPNIDELFTRDRLHEMLGQSDYVVVTAPRTPETLGMLGEAEFRAMKRSAFFVCFSRGGIADDAALLRALQEGWIAGAGLDAHGTEPLPPGSPFWSLPNTIITPHNGATTPQSRQRGVDIFVENLRHYLAGEALRNVVDKQAGY